MSTLHPTQNLVCFPQRVERPLETCSCEFESHSWLTADFALSDHLIPPLRNGDDYICLCWVSSMSSCRSTYFHPVCSYRYNDRPPCPLISGLVWPVESGWVWRMGGKRCGIYSSGCHSGSLLVGSILYTRPHLLLGSSLNMTTLCGFCNHLNPCLAGLGLKPFLTFASPRILFFVAFPNPANVFISLSITGLSVSSLSYQEIQL